MPGDFDVFLSYNRQEADGVRELAARLRERGLRPWLDVDELVPGFPWLDGLEEAIRSARAAAVFVGGSGLGPWMRPEIRALLAQMVERGLAVIPVLLPGTPERPELPLFLRDFTWVDLRQGVTPEGIDQLVRGIRRDVERGASLPGPDRADAALPSGSMPRAAVFGPGPPLPGQALAVELLTQPVLLAREPDGRIRLTVDRRGVVAALHDNGGKRPLVEAALGTPERCEAARRLDREIHRFLLGDASRQFLAVEGLPLRWASGGVMSVVRWHGRTWTPFFFRDIAPYGWNLALGSSERGDDLNDPWTFLVREFLEETLVLAGAPRQGGALEVKPFLFHKLKIDDEIARAHRFSAEHIRIRLERDHLAIHFPPVEAARAGLATRVRLAAAPVDVDVFHESGDNLSGDFFVSVNLLELGIEVVKVVEYALADDDSLLDGELYEVGGRPELVRMPVALLSHDYLARAFGPGTPEPTYVGELQPSIEGPAIPPEDVHLFPFDVERRRALATTEAARASAWETERYGGWLERFGAHFYDDTGRATGRNACRLFTPTAAKVASYYFASRVRG